MRKTYLITGVAGFIGFFLSKRLLENNDIVIGIDNLNEYYDIYLKKTRLDILSQFERFCFHKIDISNENDLHKIFSKYKPEYVIHLAAQAGVRYSVTNPDVYISSNIIGTYNILEMCRKYPVEHLVYASSSSVYGMNNKVPFNESDFVDCPISLYAATKKSNELLAYSYSHLFDIPATGLRFFTVYGPMGRPDMAYFKFTDMFFNNEAIKIYNNGDFENDMYRDFTYIDDIVEGVTRIINVPPIDLKTKHRILNIGNNAPENLMDFIRILENCLSESLNRKVVFQKEFVPIEPGDVKATYADTTKLESLVGFKPKTKIKEGLQKFTNWYVEYYKKS